VARRGHPLLYGCPRTEGRQPASQHARGPDDWLQHWEAGLDVVIEGEAVQVADDLRLQRLAAAWATKWDGRWQYEARAGSFHHPDGGAALVFSVTPTKILAFAKGRFSHTRYLFQSTA
jgi:hypothetical protein